MVLLFSFGTPLMPVDRHVERVSKRIGLMPPKATADEGHEQWLAMLEPDQMYAAHVGVISHGRQTCHARNPACDSCPIAPRCRYLDRASALRGRATRPVDARGPSDPDDQLDQLVDEFLEEEFELSPVTASALGLTDVRRGHGRPVRGRASPSAIATPVDFLERFAALADEDLTADERIDRDLAAGDAARTARSSPSGRAGSATH